MSKLSFVLKSFSLFIFVFFAQNSLAQGQQKTKTVQPKKTIAQTQPAVATSEVQNTNAAQPAPTAQTEADLALLEEQKQEIAKIKSQQQRIAEKIRSLTPEQRQIVKDEIRRHRETMRDLLGDVWQNQEPVTNGFNNTAPNQTVTQTDGQMQQNQNGTIAPVAPQPVNNSTANPPLPPMPNITPNGKSPNQLPKPPVPAQR